MAKKRAFTLIELLVVIAILALLIAIAIPSFMKSTERAKTTADEANRRILESAAVAHISDGNESFTWDKTTGDSETGWGNYLDEWPENPIDKEADYVLTCTDSNIEINPPVATTE